MNRITRVFAIVLVLLLLTTAWFWWNQPRKVDMAAYVPADSMVYVESNSLADVARALMATEAYRDLAPLVDLQVHARQSSWLTSLARVTGLGSVQSVIALRAQVALVMLDLNATSNDRTLDFKPLAALVIETHTSASRIKPAIEQLVGDFARRAFGQPVSERITRDGLEFVKWKSTDGQRQIVVAIDGTTAVIGNDERAVSACIAVRQGRVPSLAHQTDLEEMRRRVRAGDALAFGYISSANAARLLSVMAPALFGKLPEAGEFQRLLEVSSAKVLGSIAWSARPTNGGIEDYYFMSMKPDLAQRLGPALKTTTGGHQTWQLLPADTFSVTNYNFSDPEAAWRALNAVVSSQLDALAAVFFTAVSKASLSPYGIEDPNTFFKAIKPEVLTARLDNASERSVVIAGIRDEATLRRIVSQQLGPRVVTEQINGNDLILSADERSAASFVNGYLMLGAPEDLRRCLAQRNGSGFSVAAASASNESANVLTYAQDGDRVRNLVKAVARWRAATAPLNRSNDLELAIKKLPYAVTETTFSQYGVERRTRSPLGQFSALVSLLSPEPSQ